MITGAIIGLAGAALADFHAWSRTRRVVKWKTLRIALFRWACGAAAGALMAAGLGDQV